MDRFTLRARIQIHHVLVVVFIVVAGLLFWYLIKFQRISEFLECEELNGIEIKFVFICLQHDIANRGIYLFQTISLS